VFGITAASAENPDSFEVFKFTLNIPEASSDRRFQQRHQFGNPAADNRPTIDPASLDTKFADIQSRLQAIDSATDKVLQEISALSTKSAERHQEIVRNAATRDLLGGLEQRLQRLEKMLESIQKDLSTKDYQGHFNKLQEALRHSHSGILDSLQSSSHCASLPVVSRISHAQPSSPIYFIAALAVSKNTP
jgi:mannose-binding lectin 1